MGKFVLAIDEGTTGVTAMLVDEARHVVARAYKEIGQQYPHPGWVEQDAVEIADAVAWTSRAAIAQGGAERGQVAAVGITNQRETTVLWDRRTGNPVAPAIVWQDRRTAPECERLRAKTPWLRRKTGLVPDPYFSATKLAWLLRAPRLRERAGRGELAFGTIDTWLAWRLAGRHVTDPTNASRTLLYDIHRSAWDDDLLEMFDIPEQVLPDVVPTSGVVAPCPSIGNAPLAALVGDQQSALFGQRCFKAGQAKTTYGTGAFLLQHTGTTAVRSRHGLLTTRAASPDAKARFALEGSVFTAGAGIQWLRDQLGMLRASPEIDELAAQVPDAGGLTIVPAFNGLGAPHWDPEARGAILGITRGTDRRHVARAMLEAIALQATEVLLAMQRDAKQGVAALRVDGGAAKSDLLMQMQADLLQRPVVRPANVETTAMGAALLAGLAVDRWSMKDLARGEAVDTFRPQADARAAAARMARWRKAVAAVRSLGHAPGV